MAVALVTLTVCARAEDAPALAGAAAWAKVVGNTVTGSTPDGPYSEYFSADGALVIVDGDGRAGGRWAFRDGTLCTRVDDEDEECRAVSVAGASGAFTDDGGARYPFVILAGNPKGL